jgi:hypothetical protein
MAGARQFLGKINHFVFTGYHLPRTSIIPGAGTFAQAPELLGKVSQACRVMGYYQASFYRFKYRKLLFPENMPTWSKEEDLFGLAVNA